jgi:hypothetical protein
MLLVVGIMAKGIY